MTSQEQGHWPRDWDSKGYVSPVRIVDAAAAASHRARIEAAEAEIGPLHYKSKGHTFLSSALELATDSRVLDVVENLIGPDILLYNVT